MWRERKNQVSRDSKAERKRRQKLARRDRKKRQKEQERTAAVAQDNDSSDEDAEEPEPHPAPAESAEDSIAEAASSSKPDVAEEEEPAAEAASEPSSSSRRVEQLEYELAVRTCAAKANSLILQNRLERTELQFLTQRAMVANESSRRKALEMEVADLVKEKKENRWSLHACIRNCQELRAVAL